MKSTNSFAAVDSRLSFGHVVEPGRYSTTITRPDLFEHYLTQQIGLLIRNHGVPVQIGVSQTPMPVHFAVANKPALTVPQEGVMDFTLRDVFDVPDLASMNDRVWVASFISAIFQVVFGIGRYEDSVRHYRLAIEQSAEDADTHYLLARALVGLGDVEGAREDEGRDRRGEDRNRILPEMEEGEDIPG